MRHSGIKKKAAPAGAPFRFPSSAAGGLRFVRRGAPSLPPPWGLRFVCKHVVGRRRRPTISRREGLHGRAPRSSVRGSVPPAPLAAAASVWSIGSVWVREEASAVGRSFDLAGSAHPMPTMRPGSSAHPRVTRAAQSGRRRGTPGELHPGRRHARRGASSALTARPRSMARESSPRGICAGDHSHMGVVHSHRPAARDSFFCDSTRTRLVGHVEARIVCFLHGYQNRQMPPDRQMCSGKKEAPRTQRPATIPAVP